MQETAETEAIEVIDRFESGVGWIAHPEETMQRASHALATDAGVYLVDPVDGDGVDELVAEYGDVCGVVVLLDRHKRDAAAVAARHDVPVYVPAFFDGIDAEIDAQVERFEHELGETGYVAHELVDNRFWQEAILHHDATGVLVVPEAVGTAAYYLAAGERLGVHPALRLRPPRTLARFDPDRILVGHGAGVHDDATAVLDDALDGARRRTPRLYLETARDMLPL
jgi:hypothetical protein